jgi:hypothetical protein
MGGAQRAASSGRGNDSISRRTRGSGGNTSRGRHNRSRASKFRRSNQTKQVIRLVDINGDTRTVRRRGRMNITNHSSVLDALSARASRFHRSRRDDTDNARLLWSINETGTLNVSTLDMCNKNETLQQETRELNAIPVPDKVLHIHSFAPPKKAEGTVKLIYENLDGLNTCMKDNEKVERMRELHDKLETDVAAYCECEHKINYKHKKNVKGFDQLFKGGDAGIHSIVAHNVHENIGKIQQGDTGLIMFGHLTQQIDGNESGKDPSGLGRWTVMTLQGDGVRTHIVCGYNPCGNNKLNSGTSYQQQKRFFVTVQKDLTCPKKKFHDNLIAQLKRWRDDGDCLVVCLDANKNIYCKLIGRSLTDLDGLNMSKVVGDFTGRKLGLTFF